MRPGERGSTTWVVLGFSSDDIVMAWQDARLATACAGAGAPADEIVQDAGDGDVFIRWYVGPRAAAALDRHGADWRRFAIGVVDAPPPGAGRVL
jgi:hypothetical protein